MYLILILIPCNIVQINELQVDIVFSLTIFNLTASDNISCCITLIPQSLVPVQTLGIGQIILASVHSRVEDKLGAVAAILGPVDLVAGPLGVGVAGQHEREEIFLHLPLQNENMR